jgi:hypothetical protein
VYNAVIEDTSFAIEIYAPEKGACHLIAHNYRNTFFTGQLMMPNKSAILRLATAGIPEGVLTLTLFDSAGRPCAERAVYIKKPSSLNVSMITDSTTYHHRSKLQLNIKVTDQQGKPVKALFSLATVLASRLDSIRAGDIVRYQNFDRFLPRMAAMPAGNYLKDNPNIERMLLTRFWTRYKWEDISAAPMPTTADLRACDAGDVYFRDKKPKKPVDLIIMAGKSFYTLTTDSVGHFELPTDLLRLNDGEKLTIAVAGKATQQEYTLKLHNQCATVDTSLAATWYPDAGFPKAELSVEEQQYLKKALKAVVVTATKSESYGASDFKSTTCHDWVCMYNILNCPNHPMGSPPVEGGIYNYHGRPIVYHGCNGIAKEDKFIQQVNGTYFPKEFYVADYEKFNPTEPETMTTVYWAYTIATDEKGEATVNFSTNDLNGRFACVLQGYTDHGAITGKIFYKVVADQ